MNTDTDHFASAIMDLYLARFDHLDGEEVQGAFDQVLTGFFADSEERYSADDVLRLIGEGFARGLQPQIDQAEAEASLALFRKLIEETKK